MGVFIIIIVFMVGVFSLLKYERYCEHKEKMVEIERDRGRND